MCPHCLKQSQLFGANPDGGVKAACEKHGVDYLGDIPLAPSIAEDADRGKPTVVAAPPEDERALPFWELADRVAERIGLKKQ